MGCSFCLFVCFFMKCIAPLLNYKSPHLGVIALNRLLSYAASKNSFDVVVPF